MLISNKVANAFKGFHIYNKRPTDLNGHLRIRNFTLTLSEGLIFVYQQPLHRIYENQQWFRKTAL